MDTGLRSAATRKATWQILAGLVFVGVLQQPAKSQELEFLTPQRIPEGGRVEIRTPDGLDCTAQEADKPSLSLGAGITKPSVLQGITAADNFQPTTIGPPEPMAGILITIPFGRNQGNCDKLLEMEEATARIRKAQELYDLGVINEEEFRAVGRKAYSVLLTN